MLFNLQIKLVLVFSIVILNGNANPSNPKFKTKNKFYHFLNFETLQYETTGFCAGFSYSTVSGKRTYGIKSLSPSFKPYFAFGWGINGQIYPFLNKIIYATDGNIWLVPKFKIPLLLCSHLINYFQDGNNILSIKPALGYILRTKKFHPYSSLSSDLKTLVIEIAYGYNIELNHTLPFSPHQFSIKFFFIHNHLRAKPDIYLK